MKLFATALLLVGGLPSLKATVLALQPAEPWTKLQRRPEMETFVEKLFLLAGLHKKVPVVVDPAATGHCAFAATRGGQDYIGIDPHCVKPLYQGGMKNFDAMGTLAHEVGHFIGGHTSTSGSSHAQETEADEWAGWALGRLGATLEQTLSTTAWLPAQTTPSHPGRSVRVESHARGWFRAKENGPGLVRRGNWWGGTHGHKAPVGAVSHNRKDENIDSEHQVRQKETMNDPISKTPTYGSLLATIKERIQKAQVRAALAVNRELVLLYWGIGKEILARQSAGGWGSKVVDRLANDLKAEFPSMQGLSSRNLKYMRALAEAWPEEQIVQQLVAQLPWGHNVRLLDYVKDPAERVWYARQTIEHGWSRNVLVIQIEAGLYKRQGKAITNFERSLPSPQSDLAQQLLKDPYNFDFLTLTQDALERDIETGLMEHIQKFLLELGTGFAFVGRQYPLEIADEEYRIDLLFYHLKLRCYVIIELKAGPFKPEYTGKMNFYLAAVDDMLRHPTDNPSIGLILCKSKKELVVEYALRNTATPMGIAEFRHLEQLPAELQGSLPSIEEIEAELSGAEESDDPA